MCAVRGWCVRPRRRSTMLALVRPPVQDFGGAHLLSHYGFSVSDNTNDFLPISLGLPAKETGEVVARCEACCRRRTTPT